MPAVPQDMLAPAVSSAIGAEADEGIFPERQP